MNDFPLISIITINYNNKVGLERTISSIVKQSYKDFEYIVIDGNSNDGSKEVLSKYNNQIDCCIIERDSGIYNAMNKGIKKANGKYLLFINSGDELYSKTVLEENIQYIHSEDLIYFNLLQVFENHTNVHEFPSKINYNTFIEGTIGHPTTFIKKDLFHKIGLYDESLKIVADWKFFSQAVIQYKCSTKQIKATLSKFYMDGISSTNSEATNNERQKVLVELFPEYIRLKELEKLSSDLKNSKVIRWIKRFGFLKFID